MPSCPVRTQLYGGLPSDGDFPRQKEFSIGMANAFEAAHCLLGSLGRHLGSDSNDWPNMLYVEAGHLEEELGIILDVLQEYKRPVYRRQMVDFSEYMEEYREKARASARKNIEEILVAGPRLAGLAKAKGMQAIRATQKHEAPIEWVNTVAATYAFVVQLALAATRAAEGWPENLGNPYDDPKVVSSAKAIKRHLLQLERWGAVKRANAGSTELEDVLHTIMASDSRVAGAVPTLYHYSESKFDRFDPSKASPSAVWGPGIYLSDTPEGLSGWGKSRAEQGYLYTIRLNTTPAKVIDVTGPDPMGGRHQALYERLEALIGRELPVSLKEDRLLPFITLERRFGSVSEGLRKMGFEVFIHSPPGAHRGKHYLVMDPDIIRIQSVTTTASASRVAGAFCNPNSTSSAWVAPKGRVVNLSSSNHAQWAERYILKRPALAEEFEESVWGPSNFLLNRGWIRVVNFLNVETGDRRPSRKAMQATAEMIAECIRSRRDVDPEDEITWENGTHTEEYALAEFLEDWGGEALVESLFEDLFARMASARRVASRYGSGMFFHGTYLKDALAIQKSGFRLSRARGRGAVMGPAVYISGNRDWAYGYARDVQVGDFDNEVPQDAALLHLQISPRKPLLTDPKEWPDEFRAAYTKWTGDDPDNLARDRNYRELADLARRLGYDALVYPEGTTAVFDPSVIRVVRVEPFLARDA